MPETPYFDADCPLDLPVLTFEEVCGYEGQSCTDSYLDPMNFDLDF
ncbi:hypothetical protein QUA35_23155 [Microcoleus sp. N9_B2]